MCDVSGSRQKQWRQQNETLGQVGLALWLIYQWAGILMKIRGPIFLPGLTRAFIESVFDTRTLLMVIVVLLLRKQEAITAAGRQ